MMKVLKLAYNLSQFSEIRSRTPAPALVYAELALLLPLRQRHSCLVRRLEQTRHRHSPGVDGGVGLEAVSRLALPAANAAVALLAAARQPQRAEELVVRCRCVVGHGAAADLVWITLEDN